MRDPGIVPAKTTKIEIEGIWRRGSHVRISHPCQSSTGLVTLKLQAALGPGTPEPWLARVYFDGALVREFDYEVLRYTLALDVGGEHRVPRGLLIPPRREKAGGR